ncbi:MAG: hypothetical protein E7564_06220 [Ruminococcaceae bacterium]|nr:hypothetical protein [Oscillospiraceae bacterium]
MPSKKLVLASGSILFESENDPIMEHILSLADDKDNINFVYVPTAGFDTKDNEEIVKDYCLRHGIKNCVSLYLTDESLTDEYIKNTVLNASVIFVRGGNLKFLLETWRKRGADLYFKQAYEKGVVLSGNSSGAMCWCKHGYDDCGIDGRFMFLDGLDLIPYIVCPHFEDWPSFLEDVKMQELDGIGIDNDIAISIVDGEYEIIDSGRNKRHSAYYLPADEDYHVYDLGRIKCDLPLLRNYEIKY